MAALQYFILFITMVTLLSIVHCEQFLENVGKTQSNSTKTKKLSIVSNNQPSFWKYNRSRQRQRITTYNLTDRSVQPQEDPNTPIVPELHENFLYSEEVVNYPEEAVRKLLATIGEGINLQVDKIDRQTSPGRFPDTYTELCLSQEKTMYPRAAYGYDDKTHLVVNGKNKATKRQGFRVQICSQPDGQCNAIGLTYHNGYRGRCKQYYNYLTVTAFRMINNKPEPYQQLVRLPSYCGCVAELCTGNCD